MRCATYRIKISRGNDLFEAEGDKAFVLGMIERFNQFPPEDVKTGALPKKSRGIPPVRAQPQQGGKKVSVSEFIRQLGFRKHTDLVLAFGYYLERNAGQASFTPADINVCYYEAKLESSNTSQMIIQNIRRGFIMAAKKGDDSKKKAYVLTKSGEEYVESKPEKPAK